MARLDLVNSIGVSATLTPAVRTGTATGTGVDIAGYDGAVCVISSGTITDGTLYTFEVQESENNSDWTAVADSDLIGTEPALGASDDNVVREVGYKGTARYLRVSLAAVTGSPSTGGVFAAYIIKGKARRNPVS